MPSLRLLALAAAAAVASATAPQAALRGAALIQKQPDLADQELEKIQLNEELGHEPEADNAEDNSERLTWDDDDEQVQQMREEEEYSFIQKSQKKEDPDDLADQQLEKIQLEEDLGHSLDSESGDQERLLFDDDDEEIQKNRNEEEFGASFLQVEKTTDEDPDLADQELERIQMEEDLGQTVDENSGADEERLDWDEGDEQIQEMREEEEYSFMQKWSQAAREQQPDLADQEVERLQIQESIGQSDDDASIDEERLNADDDDEQISANRQEEEYSFLQTKSEKQPDLEDGEDLADQELEKIETDEALDQDDSSAMETQAVAIDEQTEHDADAEVEKINIQDMLDH